MLGCVLGFASYAHAQAVVKARPLQVFSPGGGTVTVQAPAAGTANYNLTLPAVAPAAGQTLQSDVNGGLSWVTPSSGGGGGGSSSPSLVDANNVTLGKILYFNYNASVNIITSNGYIINVYLTPVAGKDFSADQLWWTGTGCTGTPYLNDGTGPTGGLIQYSKICAYSAQAGTLYTLSAPNANGVSTSVAIPGGSKSIENTGSGCSAAVQAAAGWALTPLTQTNAGLPATIAYPLSVQ